MKVTENNNDFILLPIAAVKKKTWQVVALQKRCDLSIATSCSRIWLVPQSFRACRQAARNRLTEEITSYYSWWRKMLASKFQTLTLGQQDNMLVLTSPCFHKYCRTPCGCKLESSRWSMSLYRLQVVRGLWQRLESAVSGSAEPRWMTRRCWLGWGRWNCSPPGR